MWLFEISSGEQKKMNVRPSMHMGGYQILRAFMTTASGKWRIVLGINSHIKTSVIQQYALSLG